MAALLSLLDALLCPNCEDCLQMEAQGHGVHACLGCGYREVR